MFDIYTTQADGTAVLVESVECLAMARDTAYHLSIVFPGESFVYCERIETSSNAVSYRKLAEGWGAVAQSDAVPLLPC